MENCSYCEQVKKELKENNIKFEEKPISKYNNEWEDIVKLTGMSITPTIKYKNNYFLPNRDYYNAKNLIDILNNFRELPFSIEERTYERLKTLNYNINIAFNRLDTILKQIETKINTDEHKSTS